MESFLMSGHEMHDVSSSLTVELFIQYGIQVLFWAAFTLVSGFLIWSTTVSREVQVAIRLKQRWEGTFARLFFLCNLAYFFVRTVQLMEDEPRYKDIAPLFQTIEGLSLVALLLVGSVVLLLQRYQRVVRLSWAAVMVVSLVISSIGSIEEVTLMAWIQMFIELSLLVLVGGGLTYQTLLYDADRKEASHFAVRFAPLALIGCTIIVVVETIIGHTRNDLQHVLVAASLLLLVASLLFWLRVVQGKLLHSGRLHLFTTAAATTMILFACIWSQVGTTHNEAIYFHQMGDKLHVTLKVTPNEPEQPNTVIVKTWLFNTFAPARHVELTLSSVTNKSLPPLHIQLAEQVMADEEADLFEGYQLQLYRAHDVEWSEAGTWQATITVEDQRGDTHEVKTTFVNR